MCVKTLPYSHSPKLPSILLPFGLRGDQTGWNDHTKSLKCLSLCSLAFAGKSSSFNATTERKMVNLCYLASNLAISLADKCHSSHAKKKKKLVVYVKVSKWKWYPVAQGYCKIFRAEKVTHYSNQLGPYMCPWERFELHTLENLRGTVQLQTRREKSQLSLSTLHTQTNIQYWCLPFL